MEGRKMMVNKSNSLFTAGQLDSLQSTQAKTINRLASGKRILTASDDAAGLAVSIAMEAQTRGLGRQITNRQDEISIIQTAESAMGTISDSIQRVRELSIQAANGTLTDSDRAAIQAEINQLNDHIDQTANNTEYNTKKLLDGSLNITLQNGKNLNITRMDSTTLGTSAIDATTQASAGLALGLADKAIATVTSSRANLCAISNGITSEIQALSQELNNTLAAHSRIADADMAMEAINLMKVQISTQAAMQVFRIDNAQRGNVLKLLGG